MRFALCLIWLLSALPAQAQQAPVPDTLDWRGYYPLAIGNAWEWYHTSLPHERQRRDIIADTMLDGRHYFVQASFSDNVFSTIRDTLLLRYDSLSTRVMARRPGQNAETAYTCDLSAPFYTPVPCGAAQASVTGEAISGRRVEYLRIGLPWTVSGRDSIAHRSMKRYGTFMGSTSYYHGVGPYPGVGEGNMGDVYVVYVRLGGRSYGRSLVVGVAREARHSLASLRLYPTPVRNHLTVESTIRDGRFILYDALGRTALVGPCDAPSCTLDTSRLPPGPYVLKLTGDRSAPVTQAFVVIR